MKHYHFMVCRNCLRPMRHRDRLLTAAILEFRAERCSDEEIACFLGIGLSRLRCL